MLNVATVSHSGVNICSNNPCFRLISRLSFQVFSTFKPSWCYVMIDFFMWSSAPHTVHCSLLLPLWHFSIVLGVVMLSNDSYYLVIVLSNLTWLIWLPPLDLTYYSFWHCYIISINCIKCEWTVLFHWFEWIWVKCVCVERVQFLYILDHIRKGDQHLGCVFFSPQMSNWVTLDPI